MRSIPAIDVPPNFITMRGIAAPWVKGRGLLGGAHGRRQASLPGRGRAVRQARRATGGTPTAPRRCCTSSIRCASNMSATRSTSIGSATSAAARRSRARRRSMSAAARACWPNRWRGWARRSPGIDASPEMIAVAREHAAATGLDDRLSRRRRPGARRPVRPRHLHGGDRACRRSGGLRERAGRSASRRAGC